MDSRAVAKAESRLRLCQKALGDLQRCQDHADFAGIWFQFLTAAKSIYTCLEQGSKVSPQSRQWFGKKANERRQDPLLQYVYQARNDEEHGLDDGTQLQPGMLLVGVSGDGFSGNMAINGSLETGLSVTSLDGKPVRVINKPARVILVPVKDRGGRVYDPPAVHLGQPLTDSSPLAVARLTTDYLSSLVSEASRLA